MALGNADAWLLSGDETGDEAISPERRQAMDEVRQWSLAQLSDADRAVIAAFRSTVELELDDGFTLLAYHGSPRSFDDVEITLARHAGASIHTDEVLDIRCGDVLPTTVGVVVRLGLAQRNGVVGGR